MSATEAGTPGPPAAPDPWRELFRGTTLSGLLAGLLATLPFALPRMEMTRTLGGGIAVIPWQPWQLVVASLWGGLFPAALGVARRDPWLTAFGFFGGWAFAYHGVAWWNPHPAVQGFLQDLVGYAHIRVWGHPMFWLNRVARLTEAPVSVALVTALIAVGVRAAWWRVLAAALLSLVPLPVFWLLAALLESLLAPRGPLFHALSFPFLLGPFALWGVLPWTVLRTPRGH